MASVGGVGEGGEDLRHGGLVEGPGGRGRVVVAGLSMGGALTLWLATRHPDLAGIAVVNAVAEPAGDLRQLVVDAIDAGTDKHRTR